MAELRTTRRINAQWSAEHHENSIGKPMVRLRLGMGNDAQILLHLDEAQQLAEVIGNHLRTQLNNTGGSSGDEHHELRGCAADRPLSAG